MALTLNNLKRVDMPLNKETKPNQTTSKGAINHTHTHTHIYIYIYIYECCVQSSTSPGGNTQQDTNCTATCPLSRKLFKLGEPDMQDIAGEAEMNS